MRIGFESSRRGAGALLAGLVSCVGFAVAASPSQALRFVGDLVYCDANANGVHDAGELPLDGVDVHVVCVDDLGATCFDGTTTTGTLHPSTDGKLATFNAVCSAEAGWNPMDPADRSGRYLVEVLSGCIANDRPFACGVAVDESTLPADCRVPVTPVVGGFPADGNGDGDLCDAIDGPFPEGQPLGNIASQGGCEAYPDPAPADGAYTVIVGEIGASDRCSLYADFGYTLDGKSGGSRTPGFWKNHPDAIDLFLPIAFCGREITEICDAVELLGTRGGGFKAWTRHAVAAALNCASFGCPSGIQGLLDAGNAACAAGDRRYGYEDAKDLLDLFNNSGGDVEAPFDFGPANPKFCKQECSGKRRRR